MCGRFTNKLTWSDIAEFYRLAFATPLNLQPRYNIAPTQDVLAVVEHKGERRAGMLRWGMVPFWAKEMPRVATINARAEEMATKPMWRDPFRLRRCIVVADGFYEWTGAAADRQPIYIARADGAPLSFAGLWDRNAALGTVSCAIVTTEANKQMRAFHPRMPVLLEPDGVDRWLVAPDHALLVPSTAEMHIHPVSKAVNSNRAEGPSLVQPMGQDMLPGFGF